MIMAVLQNTAYDTINNTNRYRPVALMAERRTPNPDVGGSNPSWPANYF